MVEFVGRCDALGAGDLDAFDESAQEISYEEFENIIGPVELERMEDELGYTGSGLTLKKDWHVNFERGLWKGEPAVNLDWSRYHHIWLIT